MRDLFYRAGIDICSDIEFVSTRDLAEHERLRDPSKRMRFFLCDRKKLRERIASTGSRKLVHTETGRAPFTRISLSGKPSSKDEHLVLAVFANWPEQNLHILNRIQYAACLRQQGYNTNVLRDWPSAVRTDDPRRGKRTGAIKPQGKDLN